VARALGELPRIHQAFGSGELSHSKVRALKRVATAQSEKERLELATHGTAAQLERIVRSYRRVTRDEASRSQEGRYLVWWWEEDGSLGLQARIPAEDGGLVLKALEAARGDLVSDAYAKREGGSAEPAVGAMIDPVATLRRLAVPRNRLG